VWARDTCKYQIRQYKIKRNATEFYFKQGDDKEKIFNNMPRTTAAMNAWLKNRKTRAFYLPTTADNLESGVLNLLEV